MVLKGSESVYTHNLMSSSWCGKMVVAEAGPLNAFHGCTCKYAQTDHMALKVDETQKIALWYCEIPEDWLST